MGIEFSLNKKRFFKKYMIAGIVVYENAEGKTECRSKVDEEAIKKLKLKIDMDDFNRKIANIMDACVETLNNNTDILVKPILVRAKAKDIQTLAKEYNLKYEVSLFKTEWEIEKESNN